MSLIAISSCRLLMYLQKNFSIIKNIVCHPSWSILHKPRIALSSDKGDVGNVKVIEIEDSWGKISVSRITF